MDESKGDEITTGVDNTKKGVEIVGEIIKAAGDNPKVKEAGDNLGQTALTITKTINNALLPIAAINYGFDKARNYFANKFEDELAEKADKIPQEDIVEPKASIAGPALQGLAFTHEEENLKEMYLSLLATSMNGKTADNAHPAFVDIIRQLNSEEAQLLQFILTSAKAQPICEVRLTKKGVSEWSTLLKHLIPIQNKETGLAEENKRYPSMVDNWIRLGLVEVDYTHSIADEASYDWAKTRPEVEKLRDLHEKDDYEITFVNGIIERTALGKEFAKAVDI